MDAGTLRPDFRRCLYIPTFEISLTVTEFDKVEKGGWFKVWLANETLERSDLGKYAYDLLDFLPNGLQESGS